LGTFINLELRVSGSAWSSQVEKKLETRLDYLEISRRKSRIRKKERNE
jgi:hypothetical protein